MAHDMNTFEIHNQQDLEPYGVEMEAGSKTSSKTKFLHFHTVWHFRGLRPRDRLWQPRKPDILVGFFVALSLSNLEGKTRLITQSLQLQTQVILASLSRSHKSAEGAK